MSIMSICVRLKILALFVLLAITAGCSNLMHSRSFVSSQADFSFYKRVGLLPFKNLVEDRLAGEKITEIFMTELLITGDLDVMDPGQFNAVVAQMAKSNTSGSSLELSTPQLIQIAEFAKVQGIFMGTVHDHRMVQIGGDQYPQISMTVKFIDAPTGTVAWQNSISATGGPNLPIVSIGETFTLGTLSQEVCEEVVREFIKNTLAKSK